MKVVLLGVGSFVLVALLCFRVASPEIAEEFEPDQMSLEQHPFFACAACHGAEGEGNKLLLAPSLAGQRPEYLRLQIESFRNEWRGVEVPAG